MNPEPKDLVFDLGGVLLEWNPEAIINASFSDPETRDRVQREIFQHPDWGDLDRGLLPPEELVNRAVQRTGLPHEQVDAMFARVTPSLILIPRTLDLLHRLKALGHRLFCLSNMYPGAITELEERYDFWHIFSGAVISGRVKAIKPDPEIYHQLLEDHSLDPETTWFFDDLPHNVEAARRIGIQAHLFTGAEDCEALLVNLGMLPRPATD